MYHLDNNIYMLEFYLQIKKDNMFMDQFKQFLS